eukprot:13528116-Ditylum_brightwellii.AAC.1
MGHPKSGSSSDAGCKQYSRGRTLHRDPQATQLQRHFSRAMHLLSLSKQKSTTVHKVCPTSNFVLDDMAEHIFPENARQTQKRYMRRNLQLVGEMTIKEWVAWASELN